MLVTNPVSVHFQVTRVFTANASASDAAPSQPEPACFWNAVGIAEDATCASDLAITAYLWLWAQISVVALPIGICARHVLRHRGHAWELLSTSSPKIPPQRYGGPEDDL